MKPSIWLRGLAMLRYPEIVEDVQERLAHLRQIAEIKDIAPTCRLNRNVVLCNYAAMRLSLGTEVTICAGTVLSFGDSSHGFGTIHVDDGVWIGQYNNLRSGENSINIGKRCLISQFCTLVASGHGTDRNLPIQQQQPPKDRCGITLDDDVWLGAGVTITPGVTVNTGAIIGAGSVVTKNVPEYEIWGGVPAQKIGDRK